jgi:hypothetical protein
MTDRELVIFAAKAADLRNVGHYDFQFGLEVMRPHSAPFAWNPLHNDGDALRLAVKLQLTVWNEHVSAGAAYCTSGDPAEGPFTVFPSVTSGANESEVIPDDFAATRRAIVRAAAEIGKAMA